MLIFVLIMEKIFNNHVYYSQTIPDLFHLINELHS